MHNIAAYLMFPDWMSGLQARSEACLRTQGRDLALGPGSGEAACLG